MDCTGTSDRGGHGSTAALIARPCEPIPASTGARTMPIAKARASVRRELAEEMSLDGLGAIDRLERIGVAFERNEGHEAVRHLGTRELHRIAFADILLTDETGLGRRAFDAVLLQGVLERLQRDRCRDRPAIGQLASEALLRRVGAAHDRCRCTRARERRAQQEPLAVRARDFLVFRARLRTLTEPA